MSRDRNFPFGDPRYMARQINEPVVPDFPGEALGEHYGYGVNGLLPASAGAGQAGAVTTLQYVVFDNAHNIHTATYLASQKTASGLDFQVMVRIGSRYLFNAAMPAGLVFGNAAGSPAPWLRALKTKTNDIVYFDCQDLSGVVGGNNVWILFNGLAVNGNS